MNRSSWRGAIFAGTIALAFLAGAASSCAEPVPVMVHFVKDSDEKMTITFPEAADFSILDDGELSDFVLVDAARNMSLGDNPATGSTGFQISGGSSGSFIYVGSGILFGDITLDDMYFGLSQVQNVSNGDTVTVLAGSLEADGPILGPGFPSDGLYDAFFTNSDGIDITGAVPEPATPALLALGIAGGAGVLFRRKSALQAVH